MPREEAEATYGEVIYDLFPVPPEVKDLCIILIYEGNGSIGT